MCKNFILTNTNLLTEEQFLKLRELVKTEITRSNDKDGYGYAAFNQNGEVFGERFLDVNNVVYQMRPDHTPEKLSFVDRYEAPKDIPEEFADMFAKVKIAAPKESNFFGTYSKPKGAFIAHARLSTNKVSMENTHPHRSKSWTLIHNGVVQNIGKEVKCTTTCDTEILVRHLERGGVQTMADSVSGRFAIAALNHDTMELLIAKDNTDLIAAWIAEIQAFAICTTKWQLDSIVKDMGWVATVPMELKTNMAWHFDVEGRLLKSQEINKGVKALTTTNGTVYGLSEYEWRKTDNKYWWEKNDYDQEKKLCDDQFNIMWKGRKIDYDLYRRLSAKNQRACQFIEKDTGANWGNMR